MKTWIKHVGLTLSVILSLAAQAQTTIDISSVMDLQKLGNDPAYPLDGCYLLTQDLDATATATWNSGAGFAPIGTSLTPFTGSLDGNGHVIRNLTINRPSEERVGLFCVLDAGSAVSNLGLEGVSIIGYGYVGGLAGSNGGMLNKCYSTGTATSSVDYGSVGGLAGYNDGIITQCYARVEVTGTIEVGGLIAINCGTIVESYATGVITGDEFVGGLVAKNFYGTITRCYAAGPVTGDSYVGGLVAYNEGGWISQCAAIGAVTGSGDYGNVGGLYVGGLVGYDKGACVAQCYAMGAVIGNVYVGGLIGFAYNPYSAQCYATGPVSGNDYVGGLVGCNATSIIGESYWDMETTGQTTAAGGGAGLSTVAMKQAASFVGWDWGIWGIHENVSYPYLLANQLPSLLHFSSPVFTIREDANSATVTVTRTGSSMGAVAVNYALQDGTAIAGADYLATSGTLYWSDGDSSNKTFVVTVLHDSVSKVNKTANLLLSNPSGGAMLSAMRQTLLSITNVDASTATIYNLTTDFSTTLNPNGVWSYNLGGTPITAPLSGTLGAGWGYLERFDGAIIKAAPAPDHTVDENSFWDWAEGDIFIHSHSFDGNDSICWTSPTNGVINILGRTWCACFSSDRDSSWNLTVNGLVVASRATIYGIARTDDAAWFTNNLVSGQSLSDIPVSTGDVVEFITYATTDTGHFLGVEMEVMLMPPHDIINGTLSPASDDFDDNILNSKKWGDTLALDGASTDVFLTETNAQMEFTGSAEVIRHWIAGYGSYTQNWEVAMDAYLGDVALSADNAYVNINLGVFNLQDTHWLNSVVNGDCFNVALDLYRDGAGNNCRGYELSSWVDTSELEGAPNHEYVSTTNQQGRLKIVFDATTKVLTASYNDNVLGSLDVDAPGSSWEMTDVGTFAFAIGGGAGEVTINSGEVYVDNFTTSGTVVSDFVGIHFPYTEIDSNENISDGVTIGQQPKPFGFMVSQTDVTHYRVSFGSAFSVDTERVGNRIQSARSIAMDTWTLLDFIMLSDGTNRVFAQIGQEAWDPTDISFMVGSWSSYTGSVTTADFVGTWNLEMYNNPNLRSLDGFQYQSILIDVQQIDAEHIRVTTPNGSMRLLRVAGNEAFLESSPVTTTTSMNHAFRIRTDGQTASFYMVASELFDPTDVNVAIGLGVKQAPSASTSSWQAGPSLLTARDQFAGGVLNGQLIVFGGNGNPSGENLKSTELFDPTASSWVYKADNNHNGGRGVEELSGAVVNGKFYVFGAEGGLNFVEEYDPSSNIWTSKAPMPTTRASATAVAYSNKIYVFGGYYDNDFGTARTNYTVVEAYDPASNTWTTETHMPRWLQSPAVAVVSNKAYVIGGAYGNWPDVHAVADVSVYDFGTHTWSTNSCAPLPTPAAFSYSGAAPVKDGKIYLIGGYPTGDITTGEVNSNNWASCFYIYDTVANTWAVGDPLPGGQIEYCYSAIIGNDLWVAGGDIAWNLNGSGDDLISGAVWKHSLSNIVASKFTDSDSDGVPDTWEQQYFGGTTNANPSAICANGINTVLESYIAGLNPTNSQSRLLISDFRSLSDGKAFDWNAVSGRVYSVYWTTNLLTGFQCLESGIPWTRDSFTNLTANPQGFYKINVRLAN